MVMKAYAITRALFRNVVVGYALVMPSAIPPANACFINSWCSTSSSNEYGSSSCSYQRQSCDNSSPSSSSAPVHRRSYGAIAFSPDSRAWGYSEEYGSRAQAESRAKKECRMNDCKIASWFYDSCGALAASENGPWGGAQGRDVQRAQKNAQARCEKEGGTNCKVLFSRCSR